MSSGDYTVGDDVGIPSLSSALMLQILPQNGILSESILFCGNFVFDEDYIIDESFLFVSEDSKVLVARNDHLTVENTTVFGCNLGEDAEFWRGIDVADQGALTFVNSKIYNAFEAILFKGSSSGMVSNSTFDYNRIGIKLTSGAPNVTIVNNQFLNTSNSGGAGAGVSAFQAVGVIGAENNPNKFLGLDNYGVTSVSSSLYVVDNEFKGISGGNPQNHSGIEGTNNSYLNVFKNKLDSVDYPFHSNNSDLNAYNNALQEFKVGYSLSLQAPNSVLLTNNYVGSINKASLLSSGVVSTMIGGDLEIWSNEISVHNAAMGLSANNYGIHVDQVGAGEIEIKNQEQMSGHNGGISVSGAGRTAGVLLNNCSDAQILSNDLVVSGNTFSGLYKIAALWADGGSDNNFRGNHVYGATLNEGEGFLGKNSTGNTLCCNTTTNFQNGFHFDGDCDDTGFTKNNMESAAHGLLVPSGGVMGVQPWQGNEWLATYSSWGALNQNSAQIFYDMSLFRVNSPAQPVHPPSVQPMGNSWFRVLQGGHSSCGQGASCPQNQGGGDGLSPMDEQLAIGNLQSLIPAGQHWLASFKLIRKLDEHPSLLGLNSAVDNWYANIQSQPIWDLYQFKKDIEGLLTIDPQNNVTLEGYRSQMSDIMEDVQDVDQDILTAGVLNWPSFSSARTTLLSQLDSFRQSYDGLRSSLDTQRQIDASTLLLDLSLISPSTPMGNHYKVLWNILLNELVGLEIDIDSTDQNTILDIATLCPDDHGPAVYEARAMTALFNYEISFDDAILCTSTSVTGVTDEVRYECFITVSPNPSFDRISIEGCGEIDNLSIWTLDGQLIKFYEGKIKEIDISDLSKSTFVLKGVGAEGCFSHRIIKK